MMRSIVGRLAVALFLIGFNFGTNVYGHGGSGPIFVQLAAKDKYERTRINELGVAIDAVVSDSVYATVDEPLLAKIRATNIRIIETFRIDPGASIQDFPKEDARFHNYQELTKVMQNLAAEYPKIFKLSSIGKSLEGRDIWCMQVNSSNEAKHADAVEYFSAKPGIVFMGNHHAREHVSAEIPLMLLEFLAKNYGVDKEITRLVDTRDVYIIPMVNPDGVEYDIATGRYRMHRKNTRKNQGGSIGVDLNRNYGFKWGTGGSSKDPSSETYMGPSEFSEPETRTIRDFVTQRPNLNVLLSFHTFSELILYPWGHKYDPVEQEQDRKAYEAMAKRMSEWNSYTPQQSSDLYIASGDTVDWAYGWSLKERSKPIFSFTFELSPKSMWEGGFYPGASILDRVFEDNLKPALYLIELADDPRRAAEKRPGREIELKTSWLN
jgi:carboxypeptidase T